MASAAGGGHIGLEQPLLFGGMRIVAAQASLFREDRPVDTVLCKHCIDHRTVAAATELIAVFLGFERSRGRGVLMALIAHFAGNRAVDVVVENPSHIRAVRIMAVGAVGGGHGVILVFQDEICCIRLVTTGTECRYA